MRAEFVFDPDVTQSPSPLLQARELAYQRNEEPVFGPLDFEVAPGEALLVHGGNGSGKTTLLRVLAGLLPAAEGSIEVAGRPASRDGIARHCALLGHRLGHKDALSAEQNLRFAIGLGGCRKGRNITTALETVGLAGYEDQPAGHLSAGQRKRLALARLWLLPAPLWLLDEPYANLDLEGIAKVNALVESHIHDGGAALITSHGAYATPAVRTRRLDLGHASD